MKTSCWLRSTGSKEFTFWRSHPGVRRTRLGHHGVQVVRKVGRVGIVTHAALLPVVTTLLAPTPGPAQSGG